MQAERRTVLLVDDDYFLRHGLRRAWLSEPYDVLLAATAQDAMSFLQRYEIHVVVADDRMPGMSGVDLLAWVAGACPETCRILLTGHASPRRLAKARMCGHVDHYLSKPFSASRLAALVNEFCENGGQRLPQ